jgi:hypothetical protein
LVVALGLVCLLMGGVSNAAEKVAPKGPQPTQEEKRRHQAECAKKGQLPGPDMTTCIPCAAGMYVDASLKCVPKAPPRDKKADKKGKVDDRLTPEQKLQNLRARCIKEGKALAPDMKSCVFCGRNQHADAGQCVANPPPEKSTGKK